MAHLSIQLLGPVRVTLDGDRITHFETQKVRALLAYVAAEAERPHEREFLAEMLWPGRPQGAARANLRHALSTLRATIGDRGRRDRPAADPPFLLTTRKSIELNLDADVSVDALDFLTLVGPPPAPSLAIAQLEKGVSLYRGPFLQDVSLGDSAAFHEWLLLKRARYHEEALSALRLLAEWYEIQGMVAQALEYARRQVELEPWLEGAHRQVMRLMAVAEQRTAALAQYEACCRLLDEEFGVEPETETTRLFERIRDGELEISRPMREPSIILQPPDFLRQEAADVAPSVFVARERELGRLDCFLARALAGHGSLAFVTGGPGQGKTALLQAFTRRAMDRHPRLLVAWGNCGAYVGVGDSYLPFRDVMAMLTGDVESRWAAGSMSRDHARRLWDSVPLVTEAVLTQGSSLIGTLLPGDALLARAATVLPHRIESLKRLKALATRDRDSPVELEQRFLFEQVIGVLRAVAAQHPLVLVLDDLQWADKASVGLLFHLGRRLAGSRILIACASRAQEVNLGRDGKPHPLEIALQEFKRTYGDVRIDLDRTDRKEGRRFVDALLDTEPNLLGEEFRVALFRRTEGHPLFTIELLRAMQERGDLVRAGGADGPWIEGATLRWEELPARVEAVIEQRIRLLDPESKDILRVASVEGAVFTAQVVALVTEMPQRPLLTKLARVLEHRHQLVMEQEEAHSDPRRIARYRFGHILIQDHIYRSLGHGERRMLHGHVAAALEDIYAGDEDQIAVQLAHHYQRSGDGERAFRYLTLAAENAARTYAVDEAILHYSRAVEIAKTLSCDDASLMRVHRGRGLAHETRGDFPSARADHERVLSLARASGDRQREWRALLDLGKLWASRDYDQTRLHVQEALKLARQMGEPEILARSLNRMGNWHVNAEDPLVARKYHDEAREIVERSGDRRGLAITLDLLGIASLLAGDLVSSVSYYDQSIDLFRNLGDRQGLASSLVGRGHAGGPAHAALAVLSPTGPDNARRDLEEALQIAQDTGNPADEAWVCWSLGLLYVVQGQLAHALEAAGRGLNIASDIGHREWIVGNRTTLGVVHTEMLDLDEARQQLEDALRLAKDLQSQTWIHFAVGALATAHLRRNDLTQARTCLESVLAPQTPMDTLYKRYCWARRAELALAEDHTSMALEIIDRLTASALGLPPGQVITFLWALKGKAVRAQGDWERGRALLQAAVDNATTTGER
ncbi:MAG: tetratricopeptide repeat protein, partial [Anaerolineae bacterium]